MNEEKQANFAPLLAKLGLKTTPQNILENYYQLKDPPKEKDATEILKRELKLLGLTKEVTTFDNPKKAAKEYCRTKETKPKTKGLYHFVKS